MKQKPDCNKQADPDHDNFGNKKIQFVSTTLNEDGIIMFSAENIAEISLEIWRTKEIN